MSANSEVLRSGVVKSLISHVRQSFHASIGDVVFGSELAAVDQSVFADITPYSCSSCALASARALRFSGVTSGKVRCSELIVVVRISATTARVTHL